MNRPGYKVNAVDQTEKRRRRGFRRLALVIAGLAFAFAAPAAQAVESVLAQPMPLASTGTTVITSQRLEFDNRERRAVFEGNVLVQDATMRMRSESLIVLFDENEQPSWIEADGGVIILQEGRLARAERAEYNIVEGKMVLKGSAEVRRGRDLLKGDTITFWRDRDRIEVVPGTLILSPETRDTRQDPRL